MNPILKEKIDCLKRHTPIQVIWEDGKPWIRMKVSHSGIELFYWFDIVCAWEELRKEENEKNCS